MKKFLFTLVALLSAGCMFAQDYLFFDDVDLRGETEGELYLQGHFEFAPQAFQIEFTSVPDGMTIVDSEAGSDSQISYKNASGRNKTSQPLWLNEGYNYMCAQAELEYYQVDGQWVSAGPVNWVPGDYEELAIFYVELDETFVGGTVEFDVAIDYGDPSDPDPRTEDYPWHTGIRHSGSFSVGDATPVLPDADEPVITFAEDGSGVMITIENYTECTVTVDGVEVSTEVPYYVEKIYDAAQVVVVYAKNAPADHNPAEATETYNLPAKEKQQTPKPSVTYSYENGELTVWAYGSGDDAEYTLYCNGEAYTGEMPITYDIYEGYTGTWTATAVAPNCTVSEMSDECPIVIEAVTPEYQTPDPVITVDVDNDAQTVTITATGEGTVTLKVTGAMGTVDEVSGTEECSIVIPFGDEVDYVNAYATATANKPGYDVIPGDATELMIEIPAKPAPTPQTAKPEINVVTNADGTVTVTVTGEGTLNVTIEGYDLELDVITYTGESPYEITLQQAEEAQEVTVSATAQKPGELESDPAVETFEIEALTPPTPQLLTGEIQFGEVNQENGQFTVTYTGNEEGVVITLNNDQIVPVRGTDKTFKLPTYGEYPVVATATAPGYENQVTGEATLVWNEPVTPPTPPTAPQITIDTEAGAIVVGATEQAGATTTLYQVTYDEDGNEVLTAIENPTAFPRTDANYSVWVKAIAVNEAGEATSTVTEVVVPAAESTGINEMMGGKTISNVRYFNMAGQEMQEANGMTIVVTTYTDGTQTAVKVMK